MVTIRTDSIPATPLTILGNLAWWIRADLGVTIATGVSAWNDQSGNGVNFTQGSGTKQPSFAASAINGQPAITGDGSNDSLNATFARVAPGTQPFYLWLVMKQVSWTTSDSICGDFTVNGCILFQLSSSPNLGMFNASSVNANNGNSIGSFSRIESQFTNSTSDYIKVGSTSVTGANAGNQAGGGTFQMFCRGDDSTRFGNITIAEAFCFLGTPTSQNRIDLDAYCTSRYGSGLV